MCVSKVAISIIVPVYKAELYLHRCLDSILAQTLTNFELLLIDDGSLDGSGRLIDEYAKKDKRVKSFHKVNGGVSSARQFGLDRAVGEYVIHVDPDDWVEPNMLEELYTKAKTDNTDMVICDSYSNYANGEVYTKQNVFRTKGKDVLIQFLKGELHGSLWNKLVRRNLFEQYNISFPEKIIRWEDLYVCCRLLYNDISVSYLSSAYYYYDLYSNANSIVRKATMQGLQSQMFFNTELEKVFSEDKYFTDLLFYPKARTIELAFFSDLLIKEEFQALYSEIHYRYSKEYSSSNSRRLVILAFKHYQLACLCSVIFFRMIELKNRIISSLFK